MSKSIHGVLQGGNRDVNDGGVHDFHEQAENENNCDYPFVFKGWLTRHLPTVLLAVCNVLVARSQ